jgi:hypothetical protein
MKRRWMMVALAALFAAGTVSAQFVPSGQGQGYGPKDGSGWQGKGPRDGTGYGAKSGAGKSNPNRQCDGTGPKRQGQGGGSGQGGGRGRR